MSREVIEECLEEMGTPPINKCLGCVNIVPNPIPMEDIKRNYEQMNNEKWDEREE